MSEQPTASGQIDPRQFDVVLVDQSHDARTAARSEADARLTAELGEGGRVRRFIRGIWKGNIAKDYYRHKYEQQALRHIEDTQDVLIHESSSETRREGAMYATIQRFQSEYEEMVHTEAGEQRAEVSDTQITDGLKGIIREYAEGRLDDESLQEERTRLLQAYRDERGDALLGEGTVQVDNLLDVARSVRGAVTHGNSLDDIIDGMRIVTAESRSGVRTSAEYSRTDQVIEKLSKSKLGLVLGSEATIAAASIAASVARFGSTRAVGAAAMTIAPGVGAGLLAGLREKKRVKDDRAQHARELAQGKQYSQEDTRRVEMERTRYETVLAPTVTAELRDYLEDDALQGDDALQRALDSLAAIRAREHMSDTKGMDLIAYSAATAVEQERFDLALARAELKVALGQRLDTDARQRLSLDEHASVDQLILTTSDTFIETYQTDIDAKDQAFRKLRNRRVAKAAAQGVAVGLTFGIVGQEIGAAMSSTREGLLEQAWGHPTQPHDGSVHETLMHGVFGDEPTGASQSMPGTEVGQDASLRTAVGDHGAVRYGETLQVSEQGGRLVVGAADGSPLADVKLRPDGSLGSHAIAELQANGIQVEDLSRTVMVETTETRTVGVDEFMQHHRGETTRIARDLWYDNDTVAPTFEANELGLHWGGENGSGRDGGGNIVLSVSTMDADGSFHSNESTDWAQDARTDNLKLAISPTEGTQARPFLVDINPDGTIHLPADSPAAKFFSIEDGQTVFNGRYAEVVEMTGRDQQGVEHVRMLATLVGNDSAANVQDTFVTETPQLRPRYEFTMPVETVVSVPADPFVEMAPVVPVVGRRSLERARSPRTSYYGEYGSFQEQLGLLRDLDKFGSPRLRDNPDAQLQLGQELDWYASATRQARGNAYVDGVEQAIASSPELSGLSGSTETIVTIPVKASGEEESDGIYDQLRLFASQGSEALAKNLVLLHVNWPVKAESEPEAAARVQRTKDEIERAKRDFPELKVATVESRWTDKDLEGGVIGHVADTMRDAALLALKRGVAEGRIPSDHEVQIIRNDADAKGIHKNYLNSFQKALETDSSVDIFTGTTRFDERRAVDLPGMVLGQHFAQMINILESGRHNKVHTGGANFGVRASTLAAIAPVLASQEFKGVGSDDVMVGRYISSARRRSRYSGSTPRFRRFGRTPYYSPYDAAADQNGRKVGKRVIGAHIDTDSQRSEEAYLAGGYFHNTWDLDFDDGGHRERGMGMNDPALAQRREELQRDIPQQVDILEKDIQYTTRIVGGVSNPAVRTSLEMMFAGLRPGGRYSTGIGYVIRNGQVRFTAEGKEFLKHRIERDGRGRFDPLGSRLSRQLYGEVRQNAKRRPLGAPLLSAT